MKTIEQTLCEVSHVEALTVWQALSQFVSNGEEAEENGCPHDAWLRPAQQLLEKLDEAMAELADEFECDEDDEQGQAHQPEREDGP